MNVGGGYFNIKQCNRDKKILIKMRGGSSSHDIRNHPFLAIFSINSGFGGLHKKKC